MFNRIHALTQIQSIIIIAAIGIAVFCSGLFTPFMGDDLPQIVDNPVVHSITNLPRFFNEGTFYLGQGSDKLSSAFYRPVMTTTFSLLYSVFGTQPVAFHVFQLLLHILCAIVLLLILRYFLQPALSLGLSVLFLVHPINGGSVFGIPSMQEPLFLLFGLLAFWVILRFPKRSVWQVLLVATLLLLSLLSKEAGITFIFVILLCVFLTDRKYFWTLLGASAAVLGVYFAMKVHAVGLASNPHNAPITELGLWARLAHVPALGMFYLAKYVFPLHLAQAYYWVHPHVTLAHFWLPLLVDLVALAVMGFGGLCIYKRSERRYLALYAFFGAWLLSGLALVMQIIPLDMTASETWFYFPSIGLIGMIGVAVEALLPRKWHSIALVAFAGILAVFGIRTFMRGFDWASPTKLSYRNIAVTKEDYISYNLIANDLMRSGKSAEATTFARQSIAIYPTFTNYNTLGTALITQKDYPAAQAAYLNALKYGSDVPIAYENLALLFAARADSDHDKGKQFFSDAIVKFPNDPTIWFCLAVFANNHGYGSAAQSALQRAQQLGSVEQPAIDAINKGQPYIVSLTL